MATTLALYARDPLSRRALAAAAERAGLAVTELSDDPRSVVAAAGPGTAFRAPGGLLAAALRIGATFSLTGPTPQWFVDLGAEITGRTWTLADPALARRVLSAGPALIKLADGKSRKLPARRYRSVGEFDSALAHAALPEAALPKPVQLLLTTEWLAIDSEYRVFTRGRDALSSSPYLVQDDPWTPLLSTHRASLHDEARDHVGGILRNLAEPDVPPAAALDVARLSDGRFVLLEANQCWSAALYSCDPDAVLTAVLAANADTGPGPDQRWLWRPDPALHGDDS